VCSEAAHVASVLWIAHTHAFDAAEYTPRVWVTSPEAGSGKTRRLEVFKLLVPRPLLVVETSVAALFRMVRLHKPTLLFDETDALFGAKANDREDLRALLNAGFERGAEVPRCVGDGANMKVEMHPVFAPVALAGLGRLPHTLETRSIVNRMKPRTADEKVERLRKRQVKPEADRLRARWAAWAKEHAEKLKDAEPYLPDELSDRTQDIWEPLLAIAELAGGEWAQRTRKAAVELQAAGEDDELSFGRHLLSDIRDVFDDPERDDPYDDLHGQAITSGGLATALADIEGSPWAEWGRDDKPISANRVARMLKPFGISPDQHKVAGKKIRGYLRDDFADAWRRHLPGPDPDGDPPPGQSGTEPKVVPANVNKGNGGTTLTPVPLSQGTGEPDAEQALRDGLGAEEVDPLEWAENVEQRRP
jgi:Protein of unknown function (DUF3631)